MGQSHLLHPSADRRPQDGKDASFIGGVPRLPPSEAFPLCELCGSEQTFFFQVALPRDQVWPDCSVATFACTSCAHEDHLIPEMLTGRLRGAEIPPDFLTRYQRNFRFLVFATAEAVRRPEYVEKVRFRRLDVVRTDDPAAPGTKIGGAPVWVLEDEAPGAYAGKTPLSFLLQLERGLAFETVEGAPAQMDVGYDGTPQASDGPDYRLFIGNAVYLFGTDDPRLRLVYAITQID